MILTRLFKNLKANMVDHPFDEHYNFVPRKMPSFKAKQPKKPPPKRSRNVGKSKHAQLTTSSSSDSPPLNNRDLPNTKLSPRSYSKALPNHTNMSQDQRETRGMFKNLARALHKFEKMLKKGCLLVISMDVTDPRIDHMVDPSMFITMTSSSKTSSPNFKRKTTRMSVKNSNFVNLDSSSEEHQNEKTSSPPPKRKSLSPPQAPSKSISSKSTHYTSSSSL
ncbi:hypothetical protein Tco_1365087 [Tanacetum coccineum]